MAAPGSAHYAELSPAPADARRQVSKPLALAASYPICRFRHEVRRSRVRLAFANRSFATVFLPIPPGEPTSPMGSLCFPFFLENTPMARPTAPSLWLPGFDPAAPALPRPAEQVCLSGSCGPAEPVEVIHVENLSDVEQEQSVVSVRANWRVVATAPEAAPRILWPQLIRADLEHLTGQSAKFEANLAAITLLRSIEAEGRPASAEDRQVLQRYTGWGGLPASFNLEAADSTWVERARRLQAMLSAEDYESARASVNNSHLSLIHI